MKTLITVLCVVALLVGCAKPVVVDWDQLEQRDGLQYFEGKPFTGRAVEKFKKGQKSGEATFKDGKAHGPWTMWYENGQKKEEATWKDGKWISLKEWGRDGNLTSGF